MMFCPQHFLRRHGAAIPERRAFMTIGIFGTGMVAQTLAASLQDSGNAVLIGTRDPGATLSRTEPGAFGNPPFSVWLKEHPGTILGSYAEMARGAEILINATSGSGSLPALESADASNLEGKILIDISNPLDFSQGFPPSLTVCNTDSLGEQIQRAFPALKVVKTLNTLTAPLMVNPALLPSDHVIFLNGNDAEAKARVTTLLGEWFGWKPSNIIDMGDITTARGTEMLLPLWVRLFGTFGTPMFNFNIVRG